MNIFSLQDEEEEVYKRDFTGATLEDHFNKTVLPKVMQVKNFGRSGRTKYSHLVDQDTTQVSYNFNRWWLIREYNNSYLKGLTSYCVQK